MADRAFFDALITAHRDHVCLLVDGALSLGYAIEDVAIYLPTVGPMRAVERRALARTVRKVAPELPGWAEDLETPAPAGRFWLLTVADGPHGGTLGVLVSIERRRVPALPAN